MATRLRTMIFGSLIIPAAVAGLLATACGGDDGGDGETAWQQLGAGGACSTSGPTPGDPATRGDAGTPDRNPEEAAEH
jgi:hypothetical protein